MRPSITETEYKDDNRPENLELWVRPQPSGIRVEDAILWAREILTRDEGKSTSNNAQSCTQSVRGAKGHCSNLHDLLVELRSELKCQGV
jgi:hypothetical protein